MSTQLPKPSEPGLLEYSVVFNDSSLNHMSAAFQKIMREISSTLKKVYHAHSVAIVPGGGTFGMEAVARQLAHDKKCLILRNGWFSYRWSQIFEAGKIPSEEIVLKAQPVQKGRQSPYAPAPIEEVVAAIKAAKPQLVFAPHVETSSGIQLPDDYMKAVAEAIHAVGGLFILDCIASGTVWVDMQAIGVDVLLSAPQKGWSASPCSALVMMSAKAREAIAETKSSSFAGDLLKWTQIMEAYEAGGHAYHATLPTDALARFHTAMQEMETFGWEKASEMQKSLGKEVRALLQAKGLISVAAKGYEAPGVVVAYTDDDGIHKGSAFSKIGMQTAAGVPLKCDEPEDFKTFRLGLFGLDKLNHVPRTVARLKLALDQVLPD